MQLKRDDMHEYQNYCTEKIIDNHIFALLLDMGLGKSIITLTAIVELMYDYFEVSKVLIIAPLRVARDTWSKECEKWEHLKGLRISKILGTEKERRAATLRRADIYIINRENVEWLCENYKFDFDMVVIDELSSFKSHQSKRFKALRKVRPIVNRIVGLTGTPAPNSLMDLWSQINLLDMGERLGRFIGGYRERYFTPDKRSREVIFSYKPREGAEDAIYKKISDICISMKALDYLDMPECIFNKVEFQMDEKEESLYKKLESEMLLSFDEGDIDAVNAAALSNKLLQMANGAVYDENGKVKIIHDKKLDVLEDLIEGANGKPVLVFYGYKHDKDRIIKRFKAEEINTSEDITRWNAGKILIAIVHPASAGHGLNLQAGGSTAIWFGLNWSLELYQQANARLWRQGQKDTVVIHHIITKGTVDEDVMKALDRKDVGQAALIEAVKVRIGGIINGKK
ncbi:DEAD/DEAH box helicase [Clostridium beijerinckii]|uniref:DEAD/DEAH box helicase n=1 Tax=Clostridium beijerinckii TaxID=1520 RepID=UPI000809B19A|nr:DEAD/DEAH box helicase [Clostridium beijerinckii]OCA97855.1 DEAD/DEAH box helicase [Clostridium beijerinckii]